MTYERHGVSATGEFVESSAGWRVGGFGGSELLDVLVVGATLGLFDIVAALLVRRLGHPIAVGAFGVGAVLRVIGFAVLLALVLVGIQGPARKPTPAAAVRAWFVIVLMLVGFYFVFPASAPQHDPVRSAVLALGAAGASAWLYARRKARR